MSVAACEVFVSNDRPTGKDVRKINRLVARAVGLEVIRQGSSRLADLDLELMPMDRVMQRWAVSIGSGLPSEEWDDIKSRPPPLDDETSMVVDQIYLHAPQRKRSLLKLWYKGPLPTLIIAERLGVSRSGVYLEWRAALMYMKQRALLSNHADLINLVKGT